MRRLLQDVKDVARFLRFVVARLREDRAAEMAASLTFTALLSLVPLLTIMLTLFSAFPVFDELANSLRHFVLSNMLPETGGRMITRYMEQFAASASRLTAMGIVLLGMTAMWMMLTIDNAFQRIFRVTVKRKLLQRILVYWAVITLAPLLVGGSLSLTSWLTGLSLDFARQLPAPGLLLLKLMPVLLSAAAFTLLFRVVPNRYVPLRHALIGGMVAAVAFALMNQAFAFYITNFPTYKLVYGAFASLPIFLLWIYFSWLMLLSGAIIAAAIPHWRSTHAPHPDQATQLYYALQVLRLLQEATATGETLVLPELSRRLRVGYEVLESILDTLAASRIVAKLAGPGWALARVPQNVTLAELLRLFLLDIDKLPQSPADAATHAWFATLEQQMRQSSAPTLRDLWAGKT